MPGNGATLSVELPHLHHDTSVFVPGAELRLRLLQYSLFPDPLPASPATGHDAVGVAASRHRSLEH